MLSRCLFTFFLKQNVKTERPVGPKAEATIDAEATIEIYLLTSSNTNFSHPPRTTASFTTTLAAVIVK
ncbi:hypothetical protein CMV_029202 [Castanea mollissima]|uniref:Uncharacterized protein n=1 Tax=Castanea mollissima TaxID=60419 RepID=A0A8J4Q5N3_9ROSI|nr:hypothetical protein CMV_029202 [Castanea mollissima]